MGGPPPPPASAVVVPLGPGQPAAEAMFRSLFTRRQWNQKSTPGAHDEGLTPNFRVVSLYLLPSLSLSRRFCAENFVKIRIKPAPTACTSWLRSCGEVSRASRQSLPDRMVECRGLHLITSVLTLKYWAKSLLEQGHPSGSSNL